MDFPRGVVVCNASLTMKLPPGIRTDRPDAGTDLPLRTQPRYGLRWQIVMLAATGLGLLSSAVAWQFTLALGRPVVYWRSLRHPQLQLLVCLGALHARHRLAVAALPLRAARPLARLAGAPPVGRDASRFGHIAAMSGVQLWLATLAGKPFAWWPDVQRSALQNFDWEMITYWAIAGLSHAVLYYRESRDRALRTSQLETQLVEAQLAALQQQLHPHFLFNTLHAISALMHKDVEAADRTLMHLERSAAAHAREHRAATKCTLKAELEFLVEVPRDRADAFRRSADGPVRHPAGNAGRAACRR